jgi:hypothetical protein
MATWTSESVPEKKWFEDANLAATQPESDQELINWLRICARSPFSPPSASREAMLHAANRLEEVGDVARTDSRESHD